MAKIAYRAQRFNRAARKTVDQANLIIEDMQEQGYVLTLRQLYYQFVSRNWIANNEQEYKRLGRIVTDAREVGEIDWMAIEDRGRQCLIHGHQDDPHDVLKGIEAAIRLNPWLEQEVYVETWVEKAALEGVLRQPCDKWRAPYMACKGYLSASEAWRAGRRFEKAIANGKRPVLIHLGDHDPSGMDMTRDNGVRLELFARQGVEVVRLALNKDQVDQYSPPPNPAKLQDSRAQGYIRQHGESSWELDALSPRVIDDLVSNKLESLIDMEKWDASLAREQELRKPLMNLAHRWDEIQQVANSPEMLLERLARLTPLVLELVGPASTLDVNPHGLLDRLASRLMAEGLYASAETRKAALVEVEKAIVGAQLPEGYQYGEDAMEQFQFGLKHAAKAADRALVALRDVPPSSAAVAHRDEATAMIDRLKGANTPTPAPERPTDPDDDAEEDDTEDLYEPDEVEQKLFGPEAD